MDQRIYHINISSQLMPQQYQCINELLQQTDREAWNLLNSYTSHFAKASLQLSDVNQGLDPLHMSPSSHVIRLL